MRLLITLVLFVGFQSTAAAEQYPTSHTNCTGECAAPPAPDITTTVFGRATRLAVDLGVTAANVSVLAGAMAVPVANGMAANAVASMANLERLSGKAWQVKP